MHEENVNKGVDQLIKIKLLGETFQFKSEEPPDNIKEIVSLLTKEFRKAEKEFPAHALKLNKSAVLVLTALNIAQRCVELEKRHDGLIKSVSSRISQIDGTIDAI